MLDKRKVVIIGAGHVGSHVAMALCFQGTCDEIAFIDIDREKAVANCYDVADACLFLGSTTKIKVGDYEDCRDADIIVNSIGMPRKPGQTRLDMLDDSIRMLKILSLLILRAFLFQLQILPTLLQIMQEFISDFRGKDAFQQVLLLIPQGLKEQSASLQI